MTNLICSLFGDSAEELGRAVSAIPHDPRIWIELRIDGMCEDALAFVRTLGKGSGRSVIATCRSIGQGGRSDLSPMDRSTLLRGVSASYHDIEFEAGGDTLATANASLPADTSSAKLLSYHDFHSLPADLPGLVGNMESHECQPEVIKIAWSCGNICENVLALKLIAEHPGRRIVICMGERGLMSRLLAAKVGAFGTFCAASDDRVVAPGQLSVTTMLDQYRWANIDSDTKFFGVIGSPVGHSLSPAIFNAQFGAQNYNGVYLPLLVESEDELTRFLENCRTNTWLDAMGFSVTIPHKEAVCRWLGDRADSAAQRIGAVNTLRLLDGEYRGFNTDYLGILEALRSGAGFETISLKSKRATIFGAGGAARAAVAALVDSGCDLTIFNRSAARAEALAREFGCEFGTWDDRGVGTPDLIVNCTSVGMWPNVDESPMPANALRAETVVFDTVYKPRQTALIQDAQAAGCRTIGGIEMFIHQAAAQYRIWTGADADLELLRQTAESALNKDTNIATDEDR